MDKRENDSDNSELVPAPKKRGRPANPHKAVTKKPPSGRGRGRPPVKKVARSSDEDGGIANGGDVSPAPRGRPRKDAKGRGRPKKVVTNDEDDDAEQDGDVQKKVSKKAPKKSATKKADSEDENDDSEVESRPSARPAPSRGRPKKEDSKKKVETPNGKKRGRPSKNGKESGSPESKKATPADKNDMADDLSVESEEHESIPDSE
ncbi:nucleolar protein dao-5-like [Teleopsis dalmanni]|uniref:nucleolar protein dao-5-like n=1 Tax=Teleopsis dalmanni TaxID=139649 RepID=UPI0018CE2784|nr:nucleolar protein dao-5-like [Teleopsis dalmanni]